jgi:hypothetical protein
MAPIPPFFYFELGAHLGWKSGSTDTLLEGGHPRIISANENTLWTLLDFKSAPKQKTGRGPSNVSETTKQI